MNNQEIREKALSLAIQAYCAEMVMEATALAQHTTSPGIQIGDYDAIIEKAKQLEDYLKGGGQADSDGVPDSLKD